MTLKLLVFAPSRRARTETFIRANLERLPFQIDAYFGDELPLNDGWRLAYGLSIWSSKLLTKLRLLRLASLPSSGVAWLLVRRHQPDVILAEFGFHAVRIMEAAAWSGVPMIVHFRGSDASSSAYLGTLERRYRRLFRLVSAVIVKSRQMQQSLQGLGADSDRMIISPSGADESLFSGSRPAQVPPRFVAVGRFVSKKGPLETLEAFALLHRSFQGACPPGLMLVMVGDGPLWSRVRQRVRELGLDEWVELPGALDRSAIAEVLRGARAFVQHSRVAANGDCEGSPVAVMEAQLSGLPVIATLHAGIPDVVIDGSTGYLVEEGDVRAMSDAMVRLALDPALADRLGQAGRRRVLANFTITHHIDAVSALVRRVASPSRPTPPLP